MSDELTARAQISDDGVLEITTNVGTNAPASYPLTITAGADWSLKVTWFDAPSSPVDLSSGYTAAFTVYDEPGGTALVSLTQAAGITLASGQPNLTVALTAAAIAAYTWGPRAWAVLTVTTGGVARALLSAPVVLRGA